MAQDSVPEVLGEQYQQHVQDQLDQACHCLQQQGFDALLIAAGGLIPAFREDVSYPYRVNSYFAEWLPLRDQPGSYVLIHCSAQRPMLLYHQPQDIWHQVNPLTDPVIEQQFEVQVVTSDLDLSKALRVVSGRRVAFIGAKVDCPLASAELNPQGLMAAWDFRRAWKSDYEVACIRLANERAVLGHQAALAAFQSEASEFQIHMAYLAAVQQQDEQLPYGNIVALNEHGAVLHYTQKLIQPPSCHRSMLIDAGATIAGYSADITRTYAADTGAQTTLFDHLLVAMDELQQRIVAQVRVGMDFVDLHRYAHQQLAKLLCSTGIITVDVQTALSQKLTHSFFPHGLGHLLGVQVHDRGGWMMSNQGDERAPPKEHPYLRLTRSLTPGMVFTIEPGLYFIEALLAPLQAGPHRRSIDWGMIDTLRPYGGIRIEDNVLLSESGPQNLTRHAFSASNSQYKQ